MKQQTKVFDLRVKLSERDIGVVEGYAATFGNKDRQGDVIEPGAFSASLATHRTKGTLPAMLLHHDLKRPIGVWESIEEDAKGLKVRGRLTQGVRDTDEAFALLKSGALHSLSIGFITKREEYNRAARANHIKQVELWEVSLVTIPANDQATITSLKQTGNHTPMNTAFKDYLRKGDGMSVKGTDLQAGVGGQGGYSVPETTAARINTQLHTISPLRSVCAARHASSNIYREVVGYGNAPSVWVGEDAVRAMTTTPDVAERVAVFGELAAMPRAYQHILEDAVFDIDAWLVEELSASFAESEGVALLSGDGVDKPQGLLDGLTAGAASAADQTTGAFEVISSGVVDALGATDTAGADFLRQQVVEALNKPYRRSAAWMMNSTTYGTIATWQDTSGRYLLDISRAPEDQRLFGFPIVINDDMDDIDR